MTQTTWVKHDLKHDRGKEAEYHLIWSETSVGHHETENPFPWCLSGGMGGSTQEARTGGDTSICEQSCSLESALTWSRRGRGRCLGSMLSYSFTSLLVPELPAHLHSPCVVLIV